PPVNHIRYFISLQNPMCIKRLSRTVTISESVF
ncbi:MAG: hypothetical protein ACJAXX_001295, partial [Roseivirga sp.]